MLNDRYKLLKTINDVFKNDVPIIITEIIIKEDSYTDKRIIETKIKNIGLQTINEVKLILEFIDYKENSKEKIPFIYENINLKNNCEISLEVNIEFKNIDLSNKIKVTISKIEFENTQKIEKEIELKQYNDSNLISDWREIGEQYKRELYSINNKQFDVKNKYEEFETIWHCACGNYCFDDIKICPECNISKEILHKITNEDYLKNKLKEYKEKQKEIEENTIKESKKIRKKILIITIIVIILACLLYFLLPFIKYSNAKKMFETGKYDQAINGFLQLGMYKDSSEYLIKAKYEFSKELYEKGNYKDALEVLLSIISYDKANTLMDEIYDKKPDLKFYNCDVGSIIKFGTYEQDNDLENGSEEIEWIILSKKENNVVEVISKYALDALPYDNPKSSLGNYNYLSSDAYLFKWLRNEFKENAFNNIEIPMISYIDLLSDYEAKKYLDGDKYIKEYYMFTTEKINGFLNAKVEATPYAKGKGLLCSQDGYCDWWTDGNNQGKYNTSYVDRNGVLYSIEDDDLFKKCMLKKSILGVRPVLTIKYSEDKK